MHDKDKTSHLHHPQFTTMQEFMEKAIGRQVRIQHSPSHVLHGQAGNMIGEDGIPEPIIRLHSGDVVRVTEKMLPHITLAELN